ncbi:alpha-hydroxy-acid oxidizing protein [Natronoglycomyces albus]|uniref:alpha-hydroxy-acid oxidizing protein n=1 Tax=Natronoglycomyces albus TaxID=2811108 RepID=UPI001FED09DD|nr:alpha-hydroxy-acid oxidizing protein [Natronoglycomyces albus]
MADETQAPEQARPTSAVPLGRAVQSRIYREGLSGRRQAAPTNPVALQNAAKKAVDARSWGYIQGAAGAERTASANVASFSKRRIIPRMLRDVSDRNLRSTAIGIDFPTPLLLSPIGVLEVAHPDADLAAARAARATGTPMTVSSQASVPMEAIAEELGDTPWIFQLYWSRNDDLALSFVRRAEKAGASAIAVTVDTHMLGWRTRDLDHGFLPFAHGMGIAQYTSDPVFQDLVDRRVAEVKPQETPRPTPQAMRALMTMAKRYPGNFRENLRSPYPRAAVETFQEEFSRPDLTWSDLSFLREHTRLPIILKGIQHPDDARQALDSGVDAIWVSNHGGRQLDGAIASIDALPGVAKVVDSAVPVIFDSGVRSGADVFRSLALGADIVGLGRSYTYGLAVGGAEGATAVLDGFNAELDITMGLAGVSDVENITAECLTDAG